MRLWTVQPPAVIEILQKRGRYVCDPTDTHVFANGHSQLLKAYRWMSNVMVERVGLPPPDCVFPVWAWHTYDGRRQSDLRKSIYRSHHHGFSCIEIEIPESRVLLSDESLWHFPLNGWYLPTDPKMKVFGSGKKSCGKRFQRDWKTRRSCDHGNKFFTWKMAVMSTFKQPFGNWKWQISALRVLYIRVSEYLLSCAIVYLFNCINVRETLCCQKKTVNFQS